MKILDELDQNQLAAATSKSLKTCINAGAGTGKTKTLTARIGWLIENQGIPAENIFAVTFTAKAARELQERVEANVGQAAHGLRIGTFHSLASRILRRHAHLCGLKDGTYGIADEDEAKKIMQEVALDPRVIGKFEPPVGMDDKGLKELEKDHASGIGDFSKRALRQISLWKSWGLTEAMASDATRDRRDDVTERMATAYGLYQHELERRNLTDFGDLILKLVDLFEREPDVRFQESEAVQHLLIDEAQDANPVQIRFAHHLISQHGALTIVGDDDQNIFGFQGSYSGAMNDLAGTDASEHTLSLNRRCTEEILSHANLIVSYNRRRKTKSLTSGRHGAKVLTTGHVTDINEAAWTAQQIAKLVEAGVDPQQVAILFRSKYTIPPFEEALARFGVSSLVVSGTSLLEREEVRDVVAFLRLALNPSDETAFIRIANKPARGLGPAAMDIILSFANSRSITFQEALETASDRYNELGLSKSARTGMRALANAMSFLNEDGRWNRPPYDVVTTALTATGYMDWLKKQDNGEGKVGYVEALHRLAEGYDDLSSFLGDLTLMTDVESSNEHQTGRVKLMTMHASKGLEFDHVFCVGYDDGVMPNGRAIEEHIVAKPGDPWNGPCGGGLEEERRLCHVAFTRARHSLTVTFPHKRVGAKGKMKQSGPSFFIEECDLSPKEMAQMSAEELGRKNSRASARRTSGYDRS